MKTTYGLLVAAVLVLCLCVSARAEMKMVPKVDNFAVCVDTSGSMMSDYENHGATDLAEAKRLLAAMIEIVPELGYNSGLYRFAKYEEILGKAVFNRADYLKGVAKLPDDVNVWKNRTPLGDGLFALAWPISEMPGKTAVILFTDGGQNEGQDPIDVAKQLYANYDICLHVVSFAQGPSEQKTIDALTSLNSCSIVVQADKLNDKAVMEGFVQDVFWEMRDITPKKVVKQKPAPTFETVHMTLNVEFDTAKWDIRPQYHDEVAKLGDFMRKFPETTAQVVGYCDSRGGYVYNLNLSMNRAESVRQYLVDNFGISPQRIEAHGYGEALPKAPNTTPENMQLNRRVEAYVTGMIIKE